MNRKLLELGLKKQRLQMVAATQRLQMAQHLQVLAPAFAAIDSAQTVGRWLKAHPQWVVGAAAVVLVVKPRTAFRWLRRGYFAWRALRRAQESLRSFAPAQ